MDLSRRLLICTTVCALCVGVDAGWQHDRRRGSGGDGLWVPKITYDQQCNPMDYGAVGDGKANDTAAVQKAMDACYKGSGEVVIPSDKAFLVGPLEVDSAKNCGLTLEEDSVLLLSNDRAKWPQGKDFLTLNSVVNYTISGTGTINGQGLVWWENRNDFRPKIVHAHGTRLLLEQVTIIDAPNHVLEMYTNYTEIRDVKIFNPPSTGTPQPSHNTDGVDVHGSPFYIHDCNITTGDDNVALHANDTLVEHCYFGTGHGASIGSLDGGWYKNITITNVVFHGTTTAVRIKTNNDAQPGLVTDVVYSNLALSDVAVGIDITQFYNNDKQANSQLFINGVTIRNVTGTSIQSAGEFVCQDTSPCRNIHLDTVILQPRNGTSPLAFTCAQAHGTASSVSPQSCLLP